MHRHTRNDSIIKKLPPEQRTILDGWLFDEELTYVEVARRCANEFGVHPGKSSVGRYYQQEWLRREVARVTCAGFAFRFPDGTELHAAEIKYRALIVRLGDCALERALTLKTDLDLKVVRELTHLIVAARRESNYALRSSLGQQKFEFDAATACLMNQIKVDAIMRDQELDDGQRIQKLREELFGSDLPEAVPIGPPPGAPGRYEALKGG